MATKDVSVEITTNTTTKIVTTKGQGASLSLSGAVGTFTFRKELPNGDLIDITDDAGNAIAITVLPTTINLWVGSGCVIHLLSAGMTGRLIVTALPLTSTP